MAAALIPIVEMQETRGKTIELGGPEIYTIRELLTEIILPGSFREDVPIYRVPESIAP